MEITILTPDERFITLNVNPSITVEDVKSLLEVKTRVTLLYDGKEMIRNSRRLSKYGVSDGDLVVMNYVSPSRNEMITNSMTLSYYQVNVGDSAGKNNVSPPRASSNELLGFNSDGSAKDPSALRQHILNDHDMMERICMIDPELGEIIRNNDLDLKRKNEWLQWYLRTRHCMRAEWERKLQNEEWTDQPLRGIIETQDYGLDKSWDAKLQHNFYYSNTKKPLYLPVEINGSKKKIYALVDTGASGSTINEMCASGCGLLELIDTDLKATFKAANGTPINMIGRVKITTVKIGDITYITSFLVSETVDGDQECIIGLDFLTNNKCVIDSDALALKIPGSDPVPFWIDAGSKPTGPGVASISSRNSTGSSRTRQLRGKVSRLVELGFERQTAITALKAARGNEELAAEFLFGC